MLALLPWGAAWRLASRPVMCCWPCLTACVEFTFDLRCDQEGSQYEYRPTFGLHSSMASRLPAYLREEIAFDADQLQLFFWRALNFLMTVPAK